VNAINLASTPLPTTTLRQLDAADLEVGPFPELARLEDAVMTVDRPDEMALWSPPVETETEPVSLVGVGDELVVRVADTLPVCKANVGAPERSKINSLLCGKVQQKPMNGAAAAASAAEQVLPMHPAMVATLVQMQSRSSIWQVLSTQAMAHVGYPVGSCAATSRVIRTIAANEEGFIILCLRR